MTIANVDVMEEYADMMLSRTLSVFAAAAMTVAVFLPARLAFAQPDRRPNIVVILVDDLRWDEISCAGHPFVRTPGIDRIARQGARFRNAFCTTPLCSPVRASLLTGQYAHHHGIIDNTNRSEQSHSLDTFHWRAVPQ